MRISIAMCTRDGALHLGEQLHSIQRQTRLPDELVLCDDASRDATLEVVKAFAQKAEYDIRLSVNSQPLGITANFEQALSLCRGDVIVLCDQDDQWGPEKLELLESVFTDDPNVAMVFTDLYVTRGGQVTKKTQWERLQFGRTLREKMNSGRAFEVLLKCNVVTGAAMAIRSSLRDLALPIPRTFVHDEWLALAAAATGRVRALDRPLVYYRGHNGQAIGAAHAGLLAQYRHARSRMDAAYFARMLDRTEQLGKWLVAHQHLLVDSEYLQMIAEKRAHMATRCYVRARRPLRWPLALAEALRGRYHRFGYGIRSLVQDLVL